MGGGPKDEVVACTMQVVQGFHANGKMPQKEMPEVVGNSSRVVCCCWMERSYEAGRANIDFAPLVVCYLTVVLTR